MQSANQSINQSIITVVIIREEVIVIFIIIFVFNCPWYSVPKGGDIRQSKLIKAVGMTTCLVHRPRRNSHAVRLRCIAAELWLIYWCFTARQHKIGQFVPMYQGGLLAQAFESRWKRKIPSPVSPYYYYYYYKYFVPITLFVLLNLT